MRKVGSTKKGEAAGENIQQQLEGLLGSGASRRKPPKWLWFAVGGGALMLAERSSPWFWPTGAPLPAR